ncbi:YpmS family protein [Peribacillus alkalitolerans]|uniref:YpmS family protein n=1 Tax=Peribacillus alkalitolerans TaxID=1550385 RepID=UPI001F07F331|nr:YpmS family protein [Peribacillus alkalitolerans]
MKRITNKWKTAFYLLLGINALLLIFLLTYALMPVKDQVIEEYGKDNPNVKFEVSTNKRDLTTLINSYLKKEGLTGPINYHIFLKEDVEFYGSLPAFGKEIQLKMTFEPESLDNGDLILKQKTMELGQVSLPVGYIMNFIQKKYKTPPWVTIDPKDEQIYVALQKIKLKSDAKVKVKEFDLNEDRITFDLLIPTK